MSTSIYKNPMNLSESEIRLVYLVEKKGVAADPYIEDIHAIKDWISTQIKRDFSLSDKTCLIYVVPEILSRNIPFIKNLHIEIISYLSTEDEYGEGQCTVHENNIIEDGIIRSAEMSVVCCFDEYGNLNSRSFFNSFYHELNHIYDAYKDLYKTGTLDRYFSSGIKGKPLFNNDIINIIFYRLFSETEQNALIAGLFGDLIGVNSIRSNYNKDFYSTQFYQIYDTIKSNYVDTINNLTADECADIYEYMLNNDIYLDIRYEKTVRSFTKAFISKVEHKLLKVFAKANKTAKYYYDIKEKTKRLVELSV